MVAGDFALPAEFEEFAGSFDSRGVGSVGIIESSCFAVKFIVPADACVEGADFVEVSGPSHAQSCPVGVDVVEFVLRFAAAVSDGGGIASEVSPEEFAVEVIGVSVFGVDFACACLGCDVRRAAVVAEGGAVDDTVEVAFEAAGSDSAFVVLAVIEVASQEDASAGVVLAAVASGSGVKVACIMALAVFEEWHDGVDMAFVLASSYEADVGGHAIAVDVRARVVVEVVAAYDGIGHEFRIDVMVFFPCAFCCIGNEIACVLDGIDPVLTVFRNDLGVRMDGAFFVFRDIDDDGVVVLFFDGCLAVDEAGVADDVFAAHHAV